MQSAHDARIVGHSAHCSPTKVDGGAQSPRDGVAPGRASPSPPPITTAIRDAAAMSTQFDWTYPASACIDGSYLAVRHCRHVGWAKLGRRASAYCCSLYADDNDWRYSRLQSPGLCQPTALARQL